MNKIIKLIIIFLFLLSNCNEKNKDVKNSNQKNDSNKTENINNENDYEFSSSDSSYFNVNLNSYIDSLRSELVSKSSTQKSYLFDICGGDCCFSMMKLFNEQEKLELFIFLHDCGDYGYSNDQFVLKNRKLIYYRKENLDILDFGTENKNTTYKAEENIYTFNKQNTVSLNRFLHTKSFEKYNLDNIKFDKKVINSDSILVEKTKYLYEKISRTSDE